MKKTYKIPKACSKDQEVAQANARRRILEYKQKQQLDSKLREKDDAHALAAQSRRRSHRTKSYHLRQRREMKKDINRLQREIDAIDEQLQKEQFSEKLDQKLTQARETRHQLLSSRTTGIDQSVDRVQQRKQRIDQVRNEKLSSRMEHASNRHHEAASKRHERHHSTSQKIRHHRHHKTHKAQQNRLEHEQNYHENKQRFSQKLDEKMKTAQVLKEEDLIIRASHCWTNEAAAERHLANLSRFKKLD